MDRERAVARAMSHPAAIPALTRNGYSRTPRAEGDIAATSGLSGDELISAFAIANETDTRHRCVEALVFHIRRAVAAGDRSLIERLFGLLLDRCEGYFRSAVRGLDDAARADIQADVLADLTRLLLADDDSSDFLQSRFWLYLRRRTVTARSEWIRSRDRLQLATDMAGDEGDDVEPVEPASAELSPEDQAILADGLARLPEQARELLILRHLEGWRVGDETNGNASGEPTLAEHYGITPRAIRKRLARAQTLLTTYRKD